MMPHHDGTATQSELVAAWISAGRVGPHPWPRAITQAERDTRDKLDELNRLLKRGKYSGPSQSDRAKATRDTVSQLRAEAVRQGLIERKPRPMTQRDQFNAWVMGGRKAEDEPAFRVKARTDSARWKREDRAGRAGLRAALAAARVTTAMGDNRAMGRGPGRPDEPLSAEAAMRLQVWFCIWDVCAVPDEFRGDGLDVRYGVVQRK